MWTFWFCLLHILLLSLSIKKKLQTYWYRPKVMSLLNGDKVSITTNTRMYSIQELMNYTESVWGQKSISRHLYSHVRLPWPTWRDWWVWCSEIHGCLLRRWRQPIYTYTRKLDRQNQCRVQDEKNPLTFEICQCIMTLNRTWSCWQKSLIFGEMAL